MAHHGHTIPETRQDNCWWISLQRRAIGSCHTNCHGQRLHGLNLRRVSLRSLNSVEHFACVKCSAFAVWQIFANFA